MFTLIPCVSRTHLELCYHFNFSKYMYVLYENKNLSMSRHAYALHLMQFTMFDGKAKMMCIQYTTGQRKRPNLLGYLVGI